MQPFTQLVRDATAEPRLIVLVFSIFASAALVLATIGLYGVVSYTVVPARRASRVDPIVTLRSE